MTLSGNVVRRIGYAGIMCLSCTDVIVGENFIGSIKPGTQGNAYGIAFTNHGTYPTAAYPASTRCIADGNVIQDIPAWEALDTHTGTYITFSNNIIEGCKLGIHAGAVEGSTQTIRGVTITGNTIIAGPAEHQHYGILVAGNSSSYAYDVVVANNVVNGYGETSNDGAGAIHCQYTGGISVSGNVVEQYAEAGILFWHDNTAFSCSGNIIGSGSAASGPVYAISVRETNNQGSIVGNRLTGRSIYVNPHPSNVVTLANNN